MFSTSRYGGGGAGCASGVSTRIGPKEPMWSQRLAEPGPPLKRNVTGRCFGSAPSAVYATEKTRAVVSFFASFRSMVPAVAV